MAVPSFRQLQMTGEAQFGVVRMRRKRANSESSLCPADQLCSQDFAELLIPFDVVISRLAPEGHL
jgi:hypothetical protein